MAMVEAAPVDDYSFAIRIMQSAFNKISSLVKELDLGTVNSPLVEEVPYYAFKFDQLADALEKLPANPKARSKEPRGYYEVNHGPCSPRPTTSCRAW